MNADFIAPNAHSQENQKNLKTDEDYINLALDLATRAEGWVSPNPYVGAILVKNGKIIGQGYHQKAGTAHAEIHAINQAKASGHDTQDSTLYVSLEPCHHQGRTGPCTHALVAAKIAKVVYALKDPNPLVSGRGHQYLVDHGIQVVAGVCQEKAHFINRIFIHQQLQAVASKTHFNVNRPYVILKAALSLDGKMATQSHDAKWITTESARQKGYVLRRQCDAILIGRGTLLADNPSLTVRNVTTLDGLALKQPIRIVVLSNFNQISADLAVFDTTIADTWLIHPKDSAIPDALKNTLLQKQVRFIQCDALTPNELLHVLHLNHIQSVLIEGGAKIHNAFLNAHLDQPCIDELALFYGACLIGNANAPSLWDQSRIQNLKDAPRLNIKTIEMIDQNIFMRAFFTNPSLNIDALEK